MDTQPSSSASPSLGEEGKLISTKNNVNGNGKHSKRQAARNLVRRTKQQLRYSCCFNDFVKDLQEQERELIKTQKGVDDGVKHSTTQVINMPVVQAWLEREANPLKGNVEEILNKTATRTRKRCCFVLPCPNLVWRYHMAKKLAKKKLEVQKCIKEGDLYIKLVDFVSTQGTQNLISSQNFLESDSTKVALEQLMKALKDDKVTMIGLYGTGGCGKTSLAMELKRAAEYKNLFNEVLSVTVSNNKVEVRSIQDRLAIGLKFPFLGDEESKRVKQLCTKLASDHKKTLVVLDDVWKPVDLDGIGIPSGKNCKNCKVLITTRFEAVCDSMKCQTKICLSNLTDEEAWDFFQKKAFSQKLGHVSDSLKHLGRLISDECKGSPLAIAVVAGSLKGKDEKDWQDALNTLRTPMNINEVGLQDVSKSLRVSYDNLVPEEAKSLLLLCSMFPEDSEIPVEDLSIFAIGLGLAGEVQLFEGARVKVSAVMNKLIDSYLLSLSDVDEGQYVRMHDVVRNVALSIASKENKVVNCVLKKDVPLECNSRRYLQYKEFANESVRSRIEFLRLETNLEVSDEIFKGMGRLRVLFLCWVGEKIGPLSTVSLKPLKNLRCLFLQSWEIDDISFVGDMTNLESLKLHHCSFFELPDVIVTQLTNLRVLHLSDCDMQRNPSEVIGRHPQLEELYFDELVSEGGGVNNGEHDEFFKKFSVPQALRRYKIKVGHEFQHSEGEILNAHRTLMLSCLDTSNVAVMDLARKAEVLLVANIRGGGKNIIPDIFQIGGGIMNYGWIELWLYESKGIKCLVDTNNHFREVGNPIPELRNLRIQNMARLGALYHGVPPSGLFEKLEMLCIHRCPVLTCLFTPAVARSLKCLEKLAIWICPKLKHIVLEEDDTEDKDHGPVFPQLKQLSISTCSKLKYIIPVAFAQGLLKLESLTVDGCRQLKYVFGQRKRGDQNQNELKIELPSLEHIQLRRLPRLISTCPRYCYVELPSRHYFQVDNCPKLKRTSVDTLKEMVDGQSMTEASLMNRQKSVVRRGSDAETPQRTEFKIKESVQEGSILEETGKVTMPTDTEGNETWQGQKMQNVDDSIQEGSNTMDKEGEIGIVSNDSIEVHPADASSSHSSIVVELGAFKHSADLNDEQIALLAEAIAVYPHLWKGLDKFSARFQALMLRTLVDMLFFLRNENAASVTPQREHEFMKLCDEAVQLGFDKSWVDGMRQRVMVSELLKMHDQLTQELCKIKDKIDDLRSFVDSDKKCFDFL